MSSKLWSIGRFPLAPIRGIDGEWVKLNKRGTFLAYVRPSKNIYAIVHGHMPKTKGQKWSWWLTKSHGQIRIEDKYIPTNKCTICKTIISHVLPDSYELVSLLKDFTEKSKGRMH